MGNNYYGGKDEKDIGVDCSRLKEWNLALNNILMGFNGTTCWIFFLRSCKNTNLRYNRWRKLIINDRDKVAETK